MKKTRIIAESGMLSALSTVLLLLGSVIDVLDLSCAVLAGFCVLMMRIRHGRIGAAAVYFTSSALALLLLPNKVPAVLYVFYGGLYPLVKPEIERLKSRALQWVIKIAFALVSFSAALALMTFVLGIDSGFTVGAPLYILIAAVAVFADLGITGVSARLAGIAARKKR